MERVRNFIILHYHANQRVGEPFWDELRAMDVQDNLKAKMALFRSSGRIMPDADELFDARGWIQVMVGQDVMPESWHPVADQVPEARLREFLDGLERAHTAEVSRMPDHAAFIAKFAPMAAEKEIVS
jgi:tryptophan halogenase